MIRNPKVGIIAFGLMTKISEYFGLKYRMLDCLGCCSTLLHIYCNDSRSLRLYDDSSSGFPEGVQSLTFRCMIYGLNHKQYIHNRVWILLRLCTDAVKRCYQHPNQTWIQHLVNVTLSLLTMSRPPPILSKYGK